MEVLFLDRELVGRIIITHSHVIHTILECVSNVVDNMYTMVSRCQVFDPYAPGPLLPPIITVSILCPKGWQIEFLPIKGHLVLECRPSPIKLLLGR